MNNKILDPRWVQLAIKGDLLKVVEVIPGKLLRVKWTAPNAPGVKEGDILKKCVDGYELIIKRGRPSVGEVVLSPLTIPKEIADKITVRANSLNVSESVMRRIILDHYFLSSKGDSK
jgi:hypothetical protein